MATRDDLKAVVDDAVKRLEVQIDGLRDRVSKTAAAVWNVRIPNTTGGATAPASAMLAHARSNCYMADKQYTPLMRALEALAPNREAKAEVRQLARTGSADPEPVTDS